MTPRTRQTLLAVAVAFSSIALPAPVTAALDMQWEQRVTREDRTRLQAIQILAACLAQRRPAQVERLLGTPIGSREQARLLNRMSASDDCIRGSIGVSASALRGALAERLVEEREASAPTADRVGPPPDEPDFGSFRARQVLARGHGLASDEESLVAARWAAGCVVRRHPEAIARLLATDVGSREEYEVLRALTPWLSACTPANSDAGVDRHAMRAAIAEAAWAIRSSAAAEAR